MRWPHGIAVADGGLLVSDAGNNRVMVWRDLPDHAEAPVQLRPRPDRPRPASTTIAPPITRPPSPSACPMASRSRASGSSSPTPPIRGSSASISRHSPWACRRRASPASAASAPRATIAGPRRPRQPVLAVRRRGLRRHARGRGLRQQPRPVVGGCAMILHRPIADGGDGGEIRVRGRVQGVGFRPTVWRIAREHGLSGEVLNDADGVLVRRRRLGAAIADFLARMHREPPPLGRIDRIETRDFAGGLLPSSASPRASAARRTPKSRRTPRLRGMRARDADPFERRFRYPFTNCTHCGPRFCIVTGIPYDRAQTTMAPFAMCPDCAQRISRSRRPPLPCRGHRLPRLRPEARLVRFDGRAVSFDSAPCSTTSMPCALLQKGEIVAVKGLGGYQLACDATNAEAVARFAPVKRRDAQALRPDGARSRDDPPLCARRRRRSGSSRARRRRSCSCAPPGRSRCRKPSLRALDARLHAADHAAAPSACCGG